MSWDLVKSIADAIAAIAAVIAAIKAWLAHDETKTIRDIVTNVQNTIGQRQDQLAAQLQQLHQPHTQTVNVALTMGDGKQTPSNPVFEDQAVPPKLPEPPAK